MDTTEEQEFETLNEFTDDLANSWRTALGEAHANADLHTLIYLLVDELSPGQVSAFPIETVRTFIIARERGVEPELMVHCLITSPTSKSSFATLKSVYSQEEKPATQVLH